MTAFEIIRESVDIIDAAGRYGIDVNRHKKALCPFHNDRNPSLSFKGQRFKCFGCGKGGDVIDLVGSLINASPMETAREINHTYGLRIDMDKPEPSAEVMRRKRQQAEKRMFAQWTQNAGDILTQYLHLLDDWRTAYAPRHPDDELDPRYLQAIHEYEYTDYIFNAVFIEGGVSEKTEFYNQYRHMVEKARLCLAKESDPHADGIRASSNRKIQGSRDPFGISDSGNGWGSYNPSGIVFPFESVAALYPQKAA